MIRKTLIILLSLIFGLFFSQDKTEIAFKKAIEYGYINSPYLIPLNINNKYLFTNSETLYFAAQEEIGKEDSESLKNWLLKNYQNHKLIFKNGKALEILDFENKKVINIQKIKKIKSNIDSKHLISGLKKLAFETKENDEIGNKFYKQRFELAQKIKLENLNFTTSEVKFLDYLSGEFYSEEMKLADLGNIKDFENSKEIFDLWKKRIEDKKTLYIKSKKEVQYLNKKFIKKYFKKYGNNYIIALFDFGVLFYVSDLDGTTHFGGFAN